MFAVDFDSNYQNNSEMYFEFYKISFNENDPDHIYQYIPLVSCTAEMFPSSLANEVEYFGISTYFLCPNLTNVNFTSGSHVSQFQYVEVSAVLWVNDSTGSNWQNADQIGNKFLGDTMRLIIVEGYYDPTDLDNPVKYKFNNKITVPTNYGWFSNKHLTIKQNQVKKLDSNTINFSTIQYEDANYFEYFTDHVSSCYFDLADSYDYYEMYIDYQPDLDSTRRNLDSASNEEELMSGEYFAFYIMALMSGLYSFFILLFDIYVNHYNKQALNHTTMNEVYKLYAIRNAEKKKSHASENNIDKSYMWKVIPAENRRVLYENQPIYREMIL